VSTVDEHGAARTLWVEGSTILARTFEQGAWRDPQIVLEEPGEIGQLRVAGYGSIGAEIIVWCVDRTTVRAANASSTGWTVQTLRSTQGASIERLELQRDLQGRALAVWVEREGDTSQSIYTARYQ